MTCFVPSMTYPHKVELLPVEVMSKGSKGQERNQLRDTVVVGHLR